MAVYDPVILKLAKSPLNYGSMSHPTVEAAEHNPVCGDKVVLQLSIRNQKIAKAMFTAEGCAIVKASASLLTEAVVGKNVDEAQELYRSVRLHLTQPETTAHSELDKLEILLTVRKRGVRVKCALLPWLALRQALADGLQEQHSTFR